MTVGDDDVEFNIPDATIKLLMNDKEWAAHYTHHGENAKRLAPAGGKEGGFKGDSSWKEQSVSQRLESNSLKSHLISPERRRLRRFPMAFKDSVIEEHFRQYKIKAFGHQVKRPCLN